MVQAARTVVAAAGCPDCGSEPGTFCVATASAAWPMPAFFARSFPHAARYHAALQGCENGCDQCWTKPDSDGVRVRLAGAEEGVTVLWSDNQTTSGRIRDLCTRLARTTDDPFDELLTIDAVYRRAARLLAMVEARFTATGDLLVVEVFDGLSPIPVSRAACPVPAGWLDAQHRRGFALGDAAGR